MIKIGKTKITLDWGNNDTNEVAITDIPKYLGEQLEIEEGVTFKRIFEICIMNRHIFNTIFYSFTRGHNIDLFIEDFLKEPQKSEFIDNIDYYEVYRNYEHFIFDDKTEDHEYYYGFHGIGKSDENGILNYGISFTSLSEMKNKQIKTNNELKIVVDTGLSYNTENFKINDKYKVIHTAQIPITLFNFIGAILYEITFFGTPANRDIVGEDLEKTSLKLEAGELETFELKKDENGRFYFESEDGEKDYLLDDEIK